MQVIRYNYILKPLVSKIKAYYSISRMKNEIKMNWYFLRAFACFIIRQYNLRDKHSVSCAELGPGFRIHHLQKSSKRVLEAWVHNPPWPQGASFSGLSASPLCLSQSWLIVTLSPSRAPGSSSSHLANLQLPLQLRYTNHIYHSLIEMAHLLGEML